MDTEFKQSIFSFWGRTCFGSLRFQQSFQFLVLDGEIVDDTPKFLVLAMVSMVGAKGIVTFGSSEVVEEVALLVA
jgi:hypothetical protein